MVSYLINRLLCEQREPKTLAEVEKHAIMAEVVSPKPVATTSSQAAVDDIQQKMDKLFVASKSGSRITPISHES